MDPDLPERCHDCLVRDTSLCGSLRDCELLELSRIGRRKKVAPGAAVTWEGDDNSVCGNIISGALKLIKTTTDGREQTVGLLTQGDFIGQPFSKFGDLTAVALSHTDLCMFPRSGFERVMEDQPRLERALLERTIKSLNESRDRQLVLTRKGARGRVAGFLVGLLDKASGNQVEVPMSRGDLADYLGLTIETVSRQVTDLKAEGVIDAGRGSRTITVLDRAALQSMAED
jgi:CRP/FNR family transcriptional regulator